MSDVLLETNRDKLDDRKYRCSHSDCNANWWENVVTNTSPSAWNAALQAFKCKVPTASERNDSMIALAERERVYQLRKIEHDTESIDREKARWDAADKVREAVVTPPDVDGDEMFESLTLPVMETESERLPALWKRDDGETLGLCPKGLGYLR